MKHVRLLPRTIVAATLAVAFGAGFPAASEAGCGCDKPPPAPAQVRPRVAYPGTSISIFDAGFALGKSLRVTFRSGAPEVAAEAWGLVESRRDLADGVKKPQLVVALPSLPLGPASLVVDDGSGAPAILAIVASELTVVAEPLAIPAEPGAYRFAAYQAAVGSDGVVYLAFDVTGVENPMIFDASAEGYALRFGAEDVVLYNSQGVLMQVLVEDGRKKKIEPIPGMFVFPAPDPGAGSDGVHYSRHEFNSYFLQHFERQPHALDPDDPNWHVDGSRHVDHNHLILALLASVAGAPPRAGATPAFDLVLRTSSLFSQGLVGVEAFSLRGSAMTSGHGAASGAPNGGGDVRTDGTLTMSDTSRVDGDATAAKLRLSERATISGRLGSPSGPLSFLEVSVPPSLPQLGAIELKAASQTIVGPGSFEVARIRVGAGSVLYVDNSAGPVTLYVTGELTVAPGGRIEVASTDPEDFAVYVAAGRPVKLTGGGSSLRGVVYAPRSTISISGDGELRGALVGERVRLSGQARVLYDRSLAAP